MAKYFHIQSLSTFISSEYRRLKLKLFAGDRRVSSASFASPDAKAHKLCWQFPKRSQHVATPVHIDLVLLIRLPSFHEEQQTMDDWLVVISDKMIMH